MKFLEDSAPLDQFAIRPIRHRLAAHPLMTVEKLIELALRHDPRYVRFHDGARELGTSFGDVLSTDPGRKALRKAIDNLGTTRTFVQILRIPLDPEYGPVIGAFLDEVDGMLPARDRGLINRDAAAFLASPGSVTPYHLDHEQNFLCHIAGPKRFSLWDGRDRAIVEEGPLEDFYAQATAVPYRKELAARSQVFDLQPGDGVYMPMGTPHAVETGPGITLTFSMLFNSRATMRQIETFKANHAFRKLRLSPSRVGARPVEDEVKRRTYLALRAAKAVMQGRRPEPVSYV
jgi:hypothetical protein